jgi:hypothetical protein
VAGADLETVRQLLSHRTLEMTMKMYTKIHSGTKRQALAKLTYGQGTLAHDHVLEYSALTENPVQDGDKFVREGSQLT